MNLDAEVANPVLAAAISELRWTLTRLVAEVNNVLGARYVSRSTVSEWVHRGRVPHNPLPTVVTHILSDALGRHVSVEALWGGKAKTSPLWIPAYDGIDVPWNLPGTLTILNDWLKHGEKFMDLDRRTFLALSGAALTGPVWEYVDSLSSSQYRAVSALPLSKDPGRRITPATAEVISATIAHMRRLDDKEGGSVNNLRFVHKHFSAVGDYVKNGQAADSTVLNSLMTSWAELGHLAGWMAFDAEQHGLAQRYFRTALQAAHTVGDRALGAHILGFMNYQACYCGQAREAVELANAAREVGRGCVPSVQSEIAVRDAYGQAAVGNLHGMQTSVAEAHSFITQPGALDTRPSWLYWWDDHNVTHEAAFMTLNLGESKSRQQLRLLDHAEQSLKSFISPENVTRQRDSLYNGARISRTFLARGQLEETIQSGRYAIAGVNSLRHARSITQLRLLKSELADQPEMRGNRDAAEFKEEIDAALVAL